LLKAAPFAARENGPGQGVSESKQRKGGLEPSREGMRDIAGGSKILLVF